MRLIDISKYEVLAFQDKSQDFVDGVQWLLEQMDKEPTVQAISLERAEKIITEIKQLSNANPSYWHSCDVVEREEVLEIIDKVIKEKG